MYLPIYIYVCMYVCMYLSRPYGFAVAEAMRQSYYIPTAQPPVSEKDALKVQVLKKTSSNELHEVVSMSAIHDIDMSRMNSTRTGSVGDQISSHRNDFYTQSRI